MQPYIIKLKPKGNISKIPEANTIFGSICWAMKELGENIEEYLKKFQENPDFIVSNCYEYINRKNEEIYFLPRPIGNLLSKKEIEELSSDEDIIEILEDNKKSIKNKEKKEYFNCKNEKISKNRKKLEIINKQKEMKKIKKITDEMFFYRLDTNDEKELFKEWLLNGCNKQIISDRKDLISDIKKYVVQKNVIDRFSMTVSEEGGTFYEEEYNLGSSGLYFLIQTENINKLKPIIKYAAEKGFGGNKSTGKGQFEIEIIEDEKNKFLTKLKKNLSKKSEYKINLGKYIPNKEEMYLEESMYEIEVVRGKIEDKHEFYGSNLDKPRIIQIKEGSILRIKDKNKKNYGNIFNVKNEMEKNIYHYAIPFFLNINEVSL